MPDKHQRDWLTLGRTTVMTEGPFAGRVGEVVELNDNSRVTVQAEFNRRSVLIEIDSAWLLPKSSAQKAGYQSVQIDTKKSAS